MQLIFNNYTSSLQMSDEPNIYDYHVLFKLDMKFVPYGLVNSNGNRWGSIVKSLLEGVKAEELPGTTADTTDDTQGKD